MNNKEIAGAFNLLAKLMELQGENPFKIRSYQSAYAMIRKLDTPLAEMDMDQIKAMKGVGKAIAGKIEQLLTEGRMSTLERYKEMVPPGIIELVQIKGLGPKKIKVAWESLGVESATELLYACNENRLIELKGFGSRSQEDIRKQLEFFLKNRSRFLYHQAHEVATEFEAAIRKLAPDVKFEWTGDYRRVLPVLEQLEVLVNISDTGKKALISLDQLELIGTSDDRQWVGTFQDLPIKLYFTNDECWNKDLFVTTGPKELTEGLPEGDYSSEIDCLEALGLPWLPPETRDLAHSKALQVDQLITIGDIKGVIHTHTTYSDGVHSIEDMAAYCQSLGYSYLGITDHSQVAVYANGIKAEDLPRQWSEIDAVNEGTPDFKVLKGIECDILSDGAMDYTDEVLKGFDFVIASVHSVLKMDQERATNRLIRAIEHPATNILGHPTGRLLLGREGYPLDMKRIVDACAANQVAIELNANPYRLDLDWHWIPYARTKGVYLSINPDAHNRESIKYIDFGVMIARKGWLDKAGCLNALDVETFLEFCQK